MSIPQKYARKYYVIINKNIKKFGIEDFKSGKEKIKDSYDSGVLFSVLEILDTLKMDYNLVTWKDFLDSDLEPNDVVIILHNYITGPIPAAIIDDLSFIVSKYKKSFIDFIVTHHYASPLENLFDLGFGPDNERRYAKTVMLKLEKESQII
jgi:hypothetical protein